jgi:protein-L-isoaspartate(D-aspartate) O-methyltransferase
MTVKEMVSEQIERRGIHDSRVLDAMLKVKRHLFVPVSVQDEAYDDRPLPIGNDQTISQPYIVAYMTQALGLEPEYRVLEAGTGSGYQTAILAELVREVYSVELLRPLADGAQQRLRDLGYENIRIKCDDGYEGWEEYAPFDAIIVTAAADEIPSKLIGQLRIGGRMVVPVGNFYSQELYLITKDQDGFDKQVLLPVMFVPMKHRF